MKIRAIPVLLLGAAALLGARAPAGPPNIVYLVLDEWGYYEWSAMGHPVFKTPNFDRLAAEGMRFTQLLAGGNVCAPTRCALMTGKHGGHMTVRMNGGGLALRPGEDTIASLLKKAGYATGGFGKWGLGDRGTTGVPEKQGFDVFFGYYHQVQAHSFFPNYLLRNSEKVPLEGNTGDFHVGKTFAQDLIFKESMDFIRKNKDRPFFAYLAWTPPHGRWGIPETDPAWKKYKDAAWDVPGARRLDDARIYAAMVEMDDRQAGAVLDLLKELGLDEKTLVVLTGDNGGLEYFKSEKHPDGFFAPNRDPRTGKRFRGGKGNFYEGGLRVPAIARWPGKIPAGAVSEHLGYFPDMLPTLCELAGVEAPKDTDGISLVPTLLGEAAAGRKQAQHEFLYWEDGRSRAVRKGPWKAILPARAKAFELYHLEEDVEEKVDLAARHPEILKELAALAEKASEPVRPGQVLDPELGFKGHPEK